MTSNTTPDNIVTWDYSDPVDHVLLSQQMGASIQAALDKRERYIFTWANSAERTAQTGMVQGSLGYQVDTKQEYVYDSSAWRARMQHAELTASKSIPSSSLTLVGTFSIDNTRSTDTNFVTPSSDGKVTVVNTGTYNLSVVSRYTVNLGDLNYVAIIVGSDANREFHGVGPFGEFLLCTAFPNVRISAGEDITVTNWQTQGGTQTAGTRLRITRID